MVTLLAIVTAAAAFGILATLAVIHLRHAPARAAMRPGGYQEATVTVNGRYRPDYIRVEQGTPVRLHFIRMEDNPCSERVIFSGVSLDRRLPAFQTTTVEFIPRSPGTFLFTCQWGMYRGRLVVTEPDGKSRADRRVRSAERNGDRATEH